MENSNKIENEQKHKKSNPGAEQEFDNIKVKNILTVSGSANLNKLSVDKAAEFAGEGDPERKNYNLMLLGNKKYFKIVSKEKQYNTPSLVFHGKNEVDSGCNGETESDICEMSVGEFSGAGGFYKGPRTKLYGRLIMDSVFKSGQMSESVDSDLARVFPAEKFIELYKLVSISSETGKLVESNGSNNTRVLGVVTRAPFLLINEAHDREKLSETRHSFEDAPNDTNDANGMAYYVTFSGVASCLVTGENGSIKPGDPLTASMKNNGLACLDTKRLPGTTIGKALEPLDRERDQIKIIKILIIPA